MTPAEAIQNLVDATEAEIDELCGEPRYDRDRLIRLAGYRAGLDRAKLIVINMEQP